MKRMKQNEIMRIAGISFQYVVLFSSAQMAVGEIKAALCHQPLAARVTPVTFL